MAVVLGQGWWLHGGDPAWGRLAQFPLLEAIAPANAGPVLQWLSTAWLWSQWLVHDLVTIFVLLPRQLHAWQLGLSAAVIGGGLCALVAWGWGPIQRMVQDKVNTRSLAVALLIQPLKAL